MFILFLAAVLEMPAGDRKGGGAGHGGEHSDASEQGAQGGEHSDPDHRDGDTEVDADIERGADPRALLLGRDLGQVVLRGEDRQAVPGRRS